MAEIRPAEGPKPVELKFRFAVSDEFIERQIEETGMKPSRHWEISVALDEVEDVDDRRLLRQAQEVYSAANWRPVLSEPPSNAIEVARALLTQQAMHAAAAEAAADAQAAYADSIQAWVEEHGSRRLRLAHARGYKVNRIYVLERIRKELPGGWVDLANDARWKEQANPSERALDLEDEVEQQLQPFATAFGTRIVFLSSFPRDMQAEHGYGEAEAVLVEQWLGHYDVLLPVDPELRSGSNVGNE